MKSSLHSPYDPCFETPDIVGLFAEDLDVVKTSEMEVIHEENKIISVEIESDARQRTKGLKWNQATCGPYSIVS